MLWLRTAYKEDIKASSTELVYGTTLKVPAEFFDSEDLDSNPQIFLEPFRIAMRNLRPKPTAHHSKTKVFVYSDLYTCSHVFLRIDASSRPLEQPYSGPHRVIERLSDRVFTILLNGRREQVSVDRLKPAYLALDFKDASNDSSEQPSTSGASANRGTAAKPTGILRTFPPAAGRQKKRVAWAQ
ncbi:uncharacterized protein LOC108632483 [Ceratina calcarata]|uniref:Uncharacterized protein LOC108632483 n=1 Tax=Ceratina calcarata TaxID=156304 RepID=A0AAJ7JH92_9HYME|nr:uncharacterized protein LOC108632483 [Ceratina calcarata]